MERVNSVHPSQSQVHTLLKCMEVNPFLAKGHVRTAMARQTAARHWHHLAVKLNNLGGANKTGKQWAKYWADKKSAVKKKGIIRLAAIKHGGGSDQVLELSQVDERIITLMGGEKFCVPETPTFRGLADPNDLPDCLLDKECEIGKDTMDEKPPNFQVVLEVDNLMDNSLQESKENLKIRRKSNDSSSNDSADNISDPLTPSISVKNFSKLSSTRPRSIRSPVTPSSTARRRELKPRSFLSTVTEGLLKIEERRLDMERENARWMRKRDKMLIETFKAVGESLNASVNCLNKLTTLLSERK